MAPADEFMPGFLLTAWIAPGADRSEPSISWPWVDITAAVRVDQGVTISAGRRDERSTVQPGSCTLKLDNDSGDFCRTNPLGQWYGLLSKNTPLRVRVTPTAPEIVDPFTRSVSSGWGYTPTGQPWYSYRSAGSLTDFATTGSSGTHAVQTNLSHRLSYLPTVQLQDAQVAATVTVAVPTGGVIEPLNLLLRGQDTSTYYMCRLVVTQTTNAVSATIIRVVDGVETVLGTTSAGLTHAAATPLRARAEAAGETIRIRAWQGSTEPGTWTLSVTDNAISLPGWVGIRSGIGSGNTNVKPLTFTYDDVQVLGEHDLFTGEVPEWAPRWDESMVDRTVPITAAGVLRRLSQGASALHSPAYRALTSDADAATLVAYWPLEEQSGATLVQSPVGSLPPTVSGDVSLGGYTGAPSTPRMVRFGTSGFMSFTVPYYSSTQHKVIALWAVPAGGVSPDRVLLRMHCAGGSLSHVELNVSPAGDLTVAGYIGTTMVDFVGPISFAVNGQDVMISVEFTETGGNIDPVRIFVQYAGGTILQFDSDFAGQSIGRITDIVAAPFNLPSVGFGHLAVANDTTDGMRAFLISTSETRAGVTGYRGEDVSTRLARVAAEENLPMVVWPGATVEMGAQPDDTLLNILRQGEAADHGVLYEFGAGLAYQPREARYVAVDGGTGAEVVLTLDADAGEIAPPEPVDDDQALRNDVVVDRAGGGSGRFEATGAMAPTGPVGRYDERVTLNVLGDEVLVDHAAWLVALGTVDDLRWPAIPLVLTGRASLALRWLGAGIGSRIQIINPPPGVGPGPIELFIEGWSCRIGWGSWTVNLVCSPARPYWTAVLEGSGNTSRLDARDASLQSGVTNSATSLTVTTTDCVWTTAAADFPFDIEIGGEQITVTNITGASSPQTFTVTRAVNGVSKAHLAGAQVRLWQPYTIAL
jgi:hypothetical protein